MFPKIMQRPIDILSNDNSLFCTEQCNNRCIMCCQPPQTDDDIELLFDENVRRIEEAPKDLPIIGITGGEPTLLGDKLIVLIRKIREMMPNTDIHLLSNGRNFSNAAYTSRVCEAGEGRIIFGIPLHADNHLDHDVIAGAKGAFEETIIGLYNLALCGACIELRVVMNKMNAHRLEKIALFIHRNLPFVSWTAFMGLEHTGLAVEHHQRVWIEPINYAKKLQKAVELLADWGHEVSVYNIPLCLLPASIHKYAQKSISDWKNNYQTCCNDCSQKDKCCGFFTTSIQTFEGIHKL